MNKVIVGIVAFIGVALGLIVVLSDGSGSVPVQQVPVHNQTSLVSPGTSQTPLGDDWDPFGEHIPPSVIPPVGPITVTSLGTGGMGLLA